MKNNENIRFVTTKLVRDREMYAKGQINTPEKAAALMDELIGDSDREQVYVFCLTTKTHLAAISLVGTGGEDASLFSASVILRTALLSGATAIILAHNHPSGLVEPSEADIKAADSLEKACDLMGIKFLDSIIVGGTGDTFYSIKAGGYMPITSGRMIVEGGKEDED